MERQRERGTRIDAERVAIGLCGDNLGDRNGAAGAGLGDHDDFLIQCRAYFVGQCAGEDIGRAPWWKSDQQSNGLGRKAALCGGHCCGKGERQSKQRR